ncbi:hypothetical protein [Paeniglutamicibacter sp. NPDC091659]|uniref:hypothetical protein n=1 Tax=Paeniglutamicibacter sp. NPDC091659 TaxID=3364389 RepID=UPI0038189039
MESENVVTEEKPRSEDFDPRSVLAEVDGVSNAMVNSTEAPRGFTLVLVALIATVMALITVVPWPAILGLCALGIPLGIWYYLVMRKRPKARPIRSHSGPYFLSFLLFMLVMQFSRFWEPGTWWEVAAKWVVLLGVGWFCMSRMHTATVNNRVKDANERPI